MGCPKESTSSSGWLGPAPLGPPGYRPLLAAKDAVPDHSNHRTAYSRGRPARLVAWTVWWLDFGREIGREKRPAANTGFRLLARKGSLGRNDGREATCIRRRKRSSYCGVYP